MRLRGLGMALKKIKLGDYIIPYKEKCGIPDLTPYDISGVNKDKEFFEPSRQTGEDTTNYQNVPPKYFACNLMHVGRDKVLPIAYNHTQQVKHVSPAYSIFKIKENDDLLDYYFFLYLKSDERDRFFWFNTDASVRDGMTWDDLCNVELYVPSLMIQQKYVDVYLAMLENQKSYERGLDDLKTTCDAYIENLRRKLPCETIGQYLTQISNKNELAEELPNRAVSNMKIFVDAKDAIVNGVDTKNYLVVEHNDFAYNTVTTRNADRLSIALNREHRCLVSPLYTTFRVNNEKLLPEYLSLWFNRSEYDRYSRFNSWGSARELFTFSTLSETSIPIPEKKVQRSIADIYDVYFQRKEFNEKLKSQIREICPILIKGSVEEAKQEE